MDEPLIVAPPKSLRVLCLDGGGIKGYTTLLILKRIMRTMQTTGQLREEPRPCDVFDLIVGTSTGGLIAVMLGRLHMSVDSCIEQYETISGKIFGRKPPGGLAGKFVKGVLNSPFYDVETLQEQIREVLKRKGFKSTETFLETKKPLCHVMLCVTRKKIAKPDVVRNYISHHPTQENYDCMIWEAASATAAAPIYFKAVKFSKGGEYFCDGGLQRNNPINEALAELAREGYWRDRSLGCVLSLGTGAPKLASVSDNLAKFLLGSVSIMSNAEDIADAFAHSPTGQNLIESRKYFRFSVPQGMEELQMDEVKETEKMKALTNEYLRKFGSGVDIEQCAKSLLYPDENLQQEPRVKTSMLPYKICAHFVRRSFYASTLQAFFKPGKEDCQRFVLWGLGGSGKTQIALDFAHGAQHHLSTYWVRADTISNFLADYTQIWALLNPDSKEGADRSDPMRIAHEVCSSLSRDPFSWLLVLDNSDDWEGFIGANGTDNVINQLIPRSGRMLLTTRDPRFMGSFTGAAHGLKVQPMDRVEARELLLNSVPSHLAHDTSEAMIENLLDELGDLPLAIAQATANISDQQLPLSEYVSMFRKKRERMGLLMSPAFDLNTSDPRTSIQSIQVTLELSFELLERKQPLSVVCLSYMGFMACRNIPSILIQRTSEFKDMTPLEFRAIVKHLLHLSLIERITVDSFDEFFIHPVVHEYISTRLTQEHAKRFLSNNIDIMNVAFLNLGSAHDNSSSTVVCRYLRPHALAQIDCAVTTGYKSKTLSQLLERVALHLTAEGITSFALALARLAIEIGHTVWGTEPVPPIQAMMTEIHCLNSDARYQEAYDQANIVLEILESQRSLQLIEPQELGHLRMQTLSEKGGAAGDLKRYDECEEIHRQLLRSGDSFTDNSARVISFRHNLANSLKNQGKYAEAEPLNRELLALVEPYSPEKSVSQRLYRYMLALRGHILCRKREGSSLHNRGPITATENVEILQIYSHLYEEYKDTSSLSDIDRWKAMNNLLGELQRRGDVEAAAQELGAVLQTTIESGISFQGRFLETFGVSFALATSLIGDLQSRGSPRSWTIADKIEELMDNCMSTAEITYVDIITTADVMNSVAVRLHQTGQYKPAEALHRQALTMTSGERSEVSDVIHYNIMLAMARQGRLAEAFAYRQQHFNEVAHDEATYGTLEVRLDRDKHDREIHQQAQEHINSGRFKSKEDSWYLENEASLRRAQRVYGVLSFPEAQEHE